MKKLFLLESMQYNPFKVKDCIPLFENYDIQFVNNVHDADILVTRKYLVSLAVYTQLIWFKKHPKIMVWTHEPRYAKSIRSTTMVYPPLEVHLRNVYLNNYAPFHSIQKLEYLEAGEAHLQRQNKIVAMARYVSFPDLLPFCMDGINIDLRKRRKNLMKIGYKRHEIDI